MSNRAFTIIELLTVTAIIVLLTGLLLPNWKAGQSQFALQRASHKLAQDIRRAQEMALAAQEFKGKVPYAYGIYFRKSEPNHYIIFADRDNDNKYTTGTDDIVEDIPIERGVVIDVLSADPLSIAFSPPRPTVAILPASPGFVRLKTGGTAVAVTRVKSVCVNKSGLITITDSCVANNPPVVTSCDVYCVAGSGSGQCISYTGGPAGEIKVEYNKQVDFTLSGVASDPDDPLASLTYHWQWGDGAEDVCGTSSCNLSHKYTTDSTIKLYVTDLIGAASGAVVCNPPSIKVVSAAAGNIQGYAWSENVGWIDFCPTTQSAPGVSAPVGTHSACSELVGSELRGWARLVSTGGWISLNCADDPGCTSGHKVSYNSSTHKFSGWAWSEDFGWISFNCLDTGVCGTSNYKVTLNTTTKKFEGYAWSENIGWIKFNSSTAPSESINYCVGQTGSGC